MIVLVAQVSLAMVSYIRIARIALNYTVLVHLVIADSIVLAGEIDGPYASKVTKHNHVEYSPMRITCGDGISGRGCSHSQLEGAVCVEDH